MPQLLSWHQIQLLLWRPMQLLLHQLMPEQKFTSFVELVPQNEPREIWATLQVSMHQFFGNRRFLRGGTELGKRCTFRQVLPEMFSQGTLIWWNDASFRNFHLTKMFSKEPCAMDYLKILPQYDIFQRNIVQDRVLWIRLEILILPRKTTIEWCVISNLPTLTKIFDVTLVQPWKSELGEYSYKKVQWGSE